MKQPMMADALFTSAKVRRSYSHSAWIYNAYTDYEAPHHLEAATLADVAPHDRVLDVACGTGRGLAALSTRLSPHTPRYGIDLTPAMLARAGKRMAGMGLGKVSDLRIGNATALPWPEAHFDLVYSGYFFDLLDFATMGKVLEEMKRVLAPKGRLILVNMSKNSPQEGLYEKLYSRGLLGPISGGCRPVLMEMQVATAGFQNLRRWYRPHKSFWLPNRWVGTEIIVARKEGQLAEKASVQ